MAQLIVRMKDNLRPHHPFPEAAYRPGDIVDVLEDGVFPGRKITPPNWLIIQLPEVSFEEAKKYKKEETIPKIEIIDDEEIIDVELIKRSKFQFNIDNLPLPIKQKGILKYGNLGDRPTISFKNDIIDKGAKK